MKIEFVPYEIALDMKSIGFNEPCFGAFIGKEFKFFDFSNDLNGYVNDKNLIIGAPLYQQAFRWFREKYDLFISIMHYENGYSINDLRRFDSYEEAELACLIKLIEIVKK
jgi:hypothetical protein